jgi:hypothetical protein
MEIQKLPLVGRQQRVLNYCIPVGNYEVRIQVRDGLVVALLVDVPAWDLKRVGLIFGEMDERSKSLSSACARRLR